MAEIGALLLFQRICINIKQKIVEIYMNNYDLIICVYACDTSPKYRNQILKMNQTYNSVLKELPNVKLLYFLGEQTTDLNGEQYIHLKNVHNDYLSASYKQFLGLKYIHENYQTKFVMCIGTDTYVNIKKLNLFLSQFDHNENLYIGGHGDTRNFGSQKLFFHSGGPGFIITNKCLAKIYPKLEHFVDDWILLCKENCNEYLIPACDVGIAYLINLQEINAKTIHCGDFIFTYCNYKGFPCHVNKICMNNLISCHNMSLNDFDEFTNILINNNYFL
jgi:hypothetical protein